MEELKKMLAQIRPVKKEFYQKAQERLDILTKPRGSLGRLEEFARRYVAITENLRPQIKKKKILVFAADHGVTEEGVSAFPKEVTSQMVFNFLRGGAGINVLARHSGVEIEVVDIGVDYDFGELPGLIKEKVAYGSKNMTKGPALGEEEVLKAIKVGIRLAQRSKEEEVDILGTGDMGIGNTTPSSAITAVITGKKVEEVTSLGTGIEQTTLRHKIKVIKKAFKVNRPERKNPLEVLAKVGGLEIAGITGLIIGSAFYRLPLVLDGFISGASALIATELNPLIKDYLLASHQSEEIGHKIILEWIGQKPILDLSLRLGEGTGAALGIFLIEAGVKVFREMATFADAGVSEANR